MARHCGFDGPPPLVRALQPVLVAVVVFELLLDGAALTLSVHVDTPDCAGTDPFCAPGGGPRPTAGAVLILTGNAALAAAVAVLRLMRPRTVR